MAVRCLLLALAYVVLVVPESQAYIGPGAGLGALGALLGVLVAVVLSLGVILSWPLRWLLRRLRKRTAGDSPAAASDGTDEAPGDAGPTTQGPPS